MPSDRSRELVIVGRMITSEKKCVVTYRRQLLYSETLYGGNAFAFLRRLAALAEAEVFFYICVFSCNSSRLSCTEYVQLAISPGKYLLSTLPTGFQYGVVLRLNYRHIDNQRKL